MPLIDLSYPAGTFTPEARTELADELGKVLRRAERAPETEFFQNITWVHVHELPDGAFFAAGRPVSEPAFRIQVTVPDGALSDRRKAEFVAEATSVVKHATGMSDADSLRIWVLINDVPSGNWGAGGQVVTIEELKGFAAREREQADAAAVNGAPAATTA
jgi:4-oxalocrotonate tautomerase family enzyme